MCINLIVVRKTVINYVSKVINIQTTGSHICCYKKLKISYPEFLHYGISLSL